MGDRPKSAEKCFRRFMESSETVLLVELNYNGRIVGVNPAADRVLSGVGDYRNKPFAQFVLGLESADLEDLAVRFSSASETSQNAVDLRTSDQDLGRYVFRAERFEDGLLLFGEPSRDELAKLRQEMQHLRKHFADTMHAYGKRSLEMSQARAELEEVQRRVERHALLDPLTQLGNRRAFMDWMRREWARFKRYNHPLTGCLAQVEGLDSLSEFRTAAAAEAAFVIVSELLVSRLRESDQIARYGDRRFGLLLCETKGDLACRVAKRLQIGVAERKLILPGGGGAVRLALGLAEAAPADKQPEDLLRRAAAALRRSMKTDERLLLASALSE